MRIILPTKGLSGHPGAVHEANLAVKAAVVEPVDVFGDGDLDVGH
jgi:hypothetical protein